MSLDASVSLFDSPVDRRKSNSMKWGAQGWVLTPEQAAADPLPMWVADMDFRAPQPVIDALVAAAQEGVLAIRTGPQPATSRR